MQTKETEKRRPGKRRGGRYKVLLIASLCTFAVLSSSLTGTVLMRRHEAAHWIFFKTYWKGCVVWFYC